MSWISLTPQMNNGYRARRRRSAELQCVEMVGWWKIVKHIHIAGSKEFATPLYSTPKTFSDIRNDSDAPSDRMHI